MDSLRQRHLGRRNLIWSITLLLAGALSAGSAMAEIATGSYTGDGGIYRSIGGLGFQPAFVIVKGDLNEPAVIRADFHFPLYSKQMAGANENLINGILGFHGDGFFVGLGPEVNDLNTEYEWVAFSHDPGFLATNTYLGDGSPDHWVYGVGFQPEVVMVVPLGDEPVQFKTIDMPDDFSTTFRAGGMNPDRIEFFGPDVFRVGSDPTVNAFDQEYGYLAFNADAAKMVHGLYTGDGLPARDIGGLGMGPEYAIVKGHEAKPAVQRPKSLADPMSMYFRDLGNLPEGIVDLKANHFTVGTSGLVNQDTETFYYVAFDQVAGSADVGISTMVDDASPDPGQEITFDVSVYNNAGSDIAHNVVVSAGLPTGLTYSGDAPEAGSYDSGTGEWTVGDIDPGMGFTLRLTALVDLGTDGQSLTVTSGIAGMDESDPDGGNNWTTTELVVSNPVAASTGQMASGTFTGNDTSDRLIGGLGFEPVLVIVKGDVAESGVIRTDIYNPGNSKQICAPAMEITDGILDFTSDGFTLGRGAGVNGQGIEYHWVAFSADPGNLRTSWYQGDGDPNRWVGGLGFQPEVVLVFNRNGEPVQFRTIDMPDDFSTSLDASTLSNNRIEYFASDGFRVGSDPAVNQPTDQYAWVAFNAHAAGVVHGMFTGDGTAHDIGPIGFGPEYVIVKSEEAQPAIHRSKGLVNPWSAHFRAEGNLNDGIVELKPDHFRVGADDKVNAPGRTLYYVAFNDLDAVADLELSQMVDDVAPDVGQEVTIDLTLGNNMGPDAANNVAVSVSLPAGLTYTGDTPGTGSFDSGTGVWTVGNLARNDSATLQVTATVDVGTEGQTLVVASLVSGMDETDPNGANNSSSTDVVVNGLQPSADLAVTILADNLTPAVGADINYTIDLVNNGLDDASNIKVDLTLETGLDYLSYTADSGSYNSGLSYWTIPALTSGASTQLRLLIRPLAGTGGATLTTVCEITEVDQADPDGSNNLDSVDVFVTDVDLAVAVAVDDQAPDENQQVVYTVDFDNLGSSDATGTAVSVALPVGLTYVGDTPSTGTFDNGTGVWTVGLLGGGGAAQLQITASVDAGTGGATLTTTAGVYAADQVDVNGANNTDSVDVIVTSADLAVAIGVDNASPDEGQQVVYTIALDNLGPSEATGTEVTVSLPAGISYVNDTPGVGTFDNGTGVWTIGSVLAAGTAMLQITASVDLGTEGSTLTTVAAVSAVDQSDPDGSNNSASVNVMIPATLPTADLFLGMGVFSNNPDEGDQVTYNVGLGNLGPNLATGTEVTVNLPAGVTYVSDTPGVGSFDSGTGVWTIGPVPAAGSLQLQIIGSIDAGTGGSTLTTTAAITAADQLDPNSANNSSLVTMIVNPVMSADLAVAIAAGEASAFESQQVTYTVDLDNLGPDDATGTKVTVALPVGLTYDGHSTATGTYNSGTGVWTIGPLANGDAAQLQVTAAVEPATAGETFTTTATVSASDQDDPVGANNVASVGIDILSSANLGVTAVFNNFNPLPGDASVLTVVLTNTGPNTATGIRVGMNLSPDLAIDGVNPTGGIWDGGAGAWTLPSLAPASTDTLYMDLTVGDVDGGTELTGAAAITSLIQIDPDASDNTALASMIVLAPGEVRLVAEPFEDSARVLLPGGPVEEVLRLALINDSSTDEILKAITISNPVTGSFDQDTQDAAWAGLGLEWRYGEKLDPIPNIQGNFSSGQLTFSGLELPVKAGQTLHLVLSGAASVNAADGMVLQPTINSAADVQFSSAVSLEGNWPLVAPGSLSIDGMTAAQIALHQVGPEVFQIDSARNLALDMTLPANGGMVDVLNKLNIVNTGTATYPQVIELMECWADDGDGLFNSLDDKLMAELRWTGGQRFEASALNEDVPLTGLRVFVTVNIAGNAPGGTVRLSLPTGDDLGVGMASDNDGPIDYAVTNPFYQTVSATDRVIISTAGLISRVVGPGDSGVPVLHLVATNVYADSRTVTQLSLRNVTMGDPVAGRAELDGTVEKLIVQRDGDGDGELDETDPEIGTTTWEAGVATFNGLDWVLPPNQESHLFITANIDLYGAADGDVIGAVVGAAQDIQFDEITALVGDWPVDSEVRYEVDGMVAAQVACPAVPPVSLTINEGPVLALDFTVPGNGYLDDTLQTLRLENLGTAVPADISALELYDDQNGNGLFEPGTDPKLADFAFVGQGWVALDVALAIPADGRRLYAGLTVASTPTDSATVQLSIPVNGAEMISGNDGPNDLAVYTDNRLLMSTAPLLSNLAFDYDLSTTEMNVTVTMTAKNVGGEDLVNVIPRDLTVTGEGAMNMVSGPQPTTLDLVQGAEGTFSWIFAGQSQGPVTAVGSSEGEGAVSHNPRESLPSGSGTHVILDPALDLDLYPVANMPFSINKGQAGVVPMTLTLLNPGGPGRANLRLEQLVVTLDDGDGNPVVPDELLSHVTVNEGANVFCDRGTLESSGQTMTLPLDPPVVVTDSEPVTLGLRLDILGTTEVDRFRVILQNASDLTVVDHVSGLPRTVQLSDDSFPVMSAAGSIVSQANGLVVTAPVQPDLTAGVGQEDVTLLQLDLVGSGEDDSSEVKVGGFSLTVVDTLGQALPDVTAYLSTLWVEGPLGINSVHPMESAADSLVVFEFQPQITVPVESLVTLTVHGELAPDPVLGPFQIQLGPTDSFDARDGNNSADVLVTYQPTEITGPRVTIQDPAAELLVAITGELRQVTALGATDVLAMTVNLQHPGPGTAAAVRLDSLRLDCLDINRQPQDPDAILDGYRVLWRGLDLSVPIFYQNEQIVVPLGGQLLDPFTQGDLELRVDVEANAPAGGFELVVPVGGILACDNNLDTTIPLEPAPGFTLPAGSNLTRLQPPSEDVVADWVDRMPPLMPTGDVRIEAMQLVLTNPAPSGAAPAELTSLVLRTSDRNGRPLAAGDVLSGIEVEFGGGVWAEISDPVASDSTLTLVGSTPLTLDPGVIVPLVIKMSGRSQASADGLRLGVLDGDVICVQPGSTSSITVSPAAGETFPFWTAATGLGKAALAESYINFPNPFAAGREQTKFAFNLDQPATVTLCIWTSRGETVTTLLSNKALEAGLYQDLVWDGRNGGGQAVHNGVYLAELKVQYQGGGSERLLRKVAVVR